MDSNYVLEHSDVAKINKLNSLTNIDTFWDDVRKFTKNVTSDHSIGRWQCLAENRFEEMRQELLLSFYVSYHTMFSEMGASVMDSIDKYIAGDNSIDEFVDEVGSSEMDLIDDLRKKYNDCIKNGYNIDIFAIRQNDNSDGIYAGLLELGLLQKQYQVFSATYKKALDTFCDKYSLRATIVRENLWFF